MEKIDEKKFFNNLIKKLDETNISDDDVEIDRNDRMLLEFLSGDIKVTYDLLDKLDSDVLNNFDDFLNDLEYEYSNITDNLIINEMATVTVAKELLIKKKTKLVPNTIMLF